MTHCQNSEENKLNTKTTLLIFTGCFRQSIRWWWWSGGKKEGQASQGQVLVVESMDEAGAGRAVAAAGDEVRRGGVVGGAVAGAG